MTESKYRASELWRRIHDRNLTAESVESQVDFKSNNVNFNIATWDPRSNGLRYLKTLLYHVAINLTTEERQWLAQTRHRNLGSPITVRCHNLDLCLDYLQAVLEVSFLSKNCCLDGSCVLEIGAGYGRTCHALLSNFAIAEYCIVDLDRCLRLARRYLAQVLDDSQYRRVRFFAIDEFETKPPMFCDLCINIDSFAEMDEGVVKEYLSYIDTHSRFCFIKNPVGKYLDTDIACDSLKRHAIDVALRMGILRDVIDIHDQAAVNKQVPAFLDAYRPGIAWEVVANAWAPPWSYYWQVMYRKK